MKRRWADRTAGILVGVLIGLGVLVYFVFVHSEGTIDAPKVNEGGSTAASAPPSRSAEESTTSPESQAPPTAPARDPGRKQRPLPVVKVIGGAPPTGSGPKELHFRVGEEVRFEVETTEPFSFEVRGLGIEESIESSSVIKFKAKRAGQFPVIASATLIGVADLLIEKKKAQ